MIIDNRFNARKFEAADVERLYVFKNDEDVNRLLGGFHTGYSRDDIRKWIEFHNANDREYLRCLAAQDSDLCVGQAGLYNIDHRNRSAEFAIALFDPEVRGKGLGSRVTRAFLDYGFEELNLHRIYLTVLKSNANAAAMYVKAGFVEEGCQRDAQFKNGAFQDVLLMSVLAPEWAAGHNG